MRSWRSIAEASTMDFIKGSLTAIADPRLYFLLMVWRWS